MNRTVTKIRAALSDMNYAQRRLFEIRAGIEPRRTPTARR